MYFLDMHKEKITRNGHAASEAQRGRNGGTNERKGCLFRSSAGYSDPLYRCLRHVCLFRTLIKRKENDAIVLILPLPLIFFLTRSSCQGHVMIVTGRGHLYLGFSFSLLTL